MSSRVAYAMKDVRVSANLERNARRRMDLAIDAVKCSLDAAYAGVGLLSISTAERAIRQAEQRAREAEENWEEARRYAKERREYARIVIANTADEDLEDMELENLESDGEDEDEANYDDEDLNMAEEEDE